MKEQAWVVVVEGEAEFAGGGETDVAGPGTLLQFDPDERHSVRATDGARLLLLLAPWPAEGHYVDSELRRKPASAQSSGARPGSARAGRSRKDP